MSQKIDSETGSVDFRQLAKELMVAVRGEHSQAYVQASLNYKSNRISKWETGDSQPSWQDLVEVGRVCEVDVPGSLAKILGVTESKLPAILKVLLGQDAIRSASRRHGIPKSTLGRWLTGESNPSVAELLELLEDYSHLCQFLETLLPSAQLPAVYVRQNLDAMAKKLFYEYPETPALICYFCARGDQQSHDHMLISERTGIPLDRVEIVIRRLLQLGLINHSEGRYVPSQVSINSSPTTREDFVRNQKTKNFWLQHLSRMLLADQFEDRKTYSSYQVIAVPEDKAERIEREFRLFFRKLFQILEEKDQPEDGPMVVKAFSMQIADAFPLKMSPSKTDRLYP